MLYLKNKLHPFNGYHVPAAIVAGIGLIGSVVGGVMQYKASQDAADAAKKAEQAKARLAATEAQRERLKQVREARIRRAQVVASTVNSGMGQDSSGMMGAVGSITSQAASNIGQINLTEGFAAQISKYSQQSADAQVRAAGWQTIGGVGNSIFEDKGGFATIFGGNTSEKAGM